MQARNSRHSIRSDRNRPNFKAATTFLAIYTALYLAVAGLVHFMTSPEAAAAMVPAAATTVSAERIDAASGSTATPELEPAADETDNSRECQLDAGIDTGCIFN